MEEKEIQTSLSLPREKGFRGFFQYRRKFINGIFSVVLILYFLLNFASYYLGGITPISSLVYSTKFTYGTKFLSYLLLFPYLLALFLANDCRIRKIPLILYLLVILGQVLVLLLAPESVTRSFRNTYGLIQTTYYSVGKLTEVIDLVNMILDFTLMYFYVYLLRDAHLERKTYPFYYFIVVFGIACCLYSFVFEGNKFRTIFALKDLTSVNAGAYAVQSTFYSENAFGILLFGAYLSAFRLFVKRHYWNLLPMILFAGVSVFTHCRSSFFSLIAFTLVYLVVRIVQLLLRGERKFFLYLGLTGTAVLIAVFLVFPNSARLPGISSFFRPFVDASKNEWVIKLGELNRKMFFDSLETGTFSGRVAIWKFSFQMIQGPFTFLGYGKTLSNDLLVIYSGYKYFAFHSIYCASYAYYGILGCLTYLSAVVMTVIYSFRKDVSPVSRALVFAALVSALIYGSMEVVFVLMSTSSVMLVANLLLAAPEAEDPLPWRKRFPKKAQ